MSYLLAIALLLLLLSTLILFRNLATFDGLADAAISRKPASSVAVCVPARNEEHTIERCVSSLLDQSHPRLTLFVLDDQSTDNTGVILQQLEKKASGKLTVMQGAPKPEDWHGKPWACHQLAQSARADILIFADSDTWFAPGAVSQAASVFEHEPYDFITVWPEQKLNTFWEKMLIPLVYYVLVGFLPADYLRQTPGWIPAALKPYAQTLLAAACGQFLAFRTEAYQAIGGHQSVQAEIVEDVALARKVKQKGFTMNMYHGLDSVYCRMYRNESEIRQGFRKNFLAGFGYSIPLFITAGILHATIYLLPYITLGIGNRQQNEMLTGLSALIIGLTLLHRLIIAFWFRWDAGYSLLHPFAVLWFQLLGLITIIDRLTGKPAQWKGRDLK